MVETTGFGFKFNPTLVPSSEREVELDISAGNMSVKKKTPSKKNQEKERKKNTLLLLCDDIISQFV